MAIKKMKIKDKHCLEAIKNEIEVMRGNKCANLITYYGCYTKKEALEIWVIKTILKSTDFYGVLFRWIYGRNFT